MFFYKALAIKAGSMPCYFARYPGLQLEDDMSPIAG